MVNSLPSRDVLNTSGLQGVIVKIGAFVKFQGSKSTGIPREEALLRKSKHPRKSPELGTLLRLAFTMHPVCTLLN